MAVKHKPKRINREKVSDWVALFGFLLMLLFFVAYTITHISVYTDIVNDDLSRYYGDYEFYVQRRHRNAICIFELKNGDKIWAMPELMLVFEEEDLPEKLTFSYSKKKNFILFAYTAVEIKSDDGEVFLSVDASRKEAYASIYLGAAFSILGLMMFILYAVCLRVKRHGFRKRKLKKRKKSEKENRALGNQDCREKIRRTGKCRRKKQT